MAHALKNIKTRFLAGLLIKLFVFIPCSFAYKVVCVDNKFSKRVVLYRGKNAAYKLIEAILKEYDYCKKNDKNILLRILLCLQKRKKDFN